MIPHRPSQFAGWHPCLAAPPVPIADGLLRVVAIPSARVASDLGSTKLLRARTFDYAWAGTGPLSLKCVFRGEARYGVGRGRFCVDVRQCLLLNEGQEYRVEVRERQGVDMFAVFFAPGFVEEVAWSLRGGAEDLLAHGPGHPAATLEVFERLLPVSPGLAQRLGRLAQVAATPAPSTAGLDEALRSLAAFLLRDEGVIARETKRLSALRPGTRRELYRRLLRARDHAASCFREPLGLGDLAASAGLSPSHLLRSFREAFGVTPHQFLTARRLEAGRRMLVDTELPVTEICLSLGFESLGSFSSLFRRHYGLPPSGVRKSHFQEAISCPDTLQ